MTTYVLPPGAWLGSGMNPPIRQSALNPPIRQSALNPPIRQSAQNPPIQLAAPDMALLLDGSAPDDSPTLEAAAAMLTQASPWRSGDAPWTWQSAQALLPQALAHAKAALVRPADPRQRPARAGRIARPIQVDDDLALWRWGAEFRQQAVLADLCWRFRVRDRVLEAAWPAAGGADRFYASVDMSAIETGRALRRQKAQVAPADALRWLDEQVDKVLRAAIEREQRLPEIMVQCDDLWSFFGWAAGIRRDSHPLAFEVLELAQQWAQPLVMALKNDIALPRPYRCSTRVLPAIPTPRHGSLPSGHATMSALIASVLAALLAPGERDPRPELLDRLARRIAYNRVVAGVHFPVDSAAGYGLGLQLAGHFVGLAMGTPAPATFVFDPLKFPQLHEIGTRPNLDPPAGDPPRSALLGQLWQAALREGRRQEAWR